MREERMQEIMLKGFNTCLGRDVWLIINEEGLLLGLEEWECIEPRSVKRFTGVYDSKGSLLFEDDEVISEAGDGVIRYGLFQNQDIENKEECLSIGFYLEHADQRSSCFGTAEEYMKK